MHRPLHKHPHRGFTLVEMLVVIAIIGILVTVLAFSLQGYLGGARQRATEGTLRKIQGLLDDRMQAFNRLDLRSDTTSALAEANDNRPLAEVLARKKRFGREFPQTFAEAAPLLIQAGRQPPAAILPEWESAQVLHFVLTQSSVLGYSPEVTDSFTSDEARVPPPEIDPSGANKDWPAFVDAWGEPLRFYRWPTRLLRPGGPDTTLDRGTASLLVASLPTSPQELSRDPDDPLGLIFGWLRQRELNGEPNVWQNFENDYHTHDTWHSPLVVSAGPDRQTGLLDPNDPLGRLARRSDDANDGPLHDNLTNLKLRAGGR